MVDLKRDYMTIKEIKKLFKDYLKNKHPDLSDSTIASYSAMAFLSYNRDLGFSFADALDSNKAFIDAKAKIEEFLRKEYTDSSEKVSSYNNGNIKKYIIAFSMLKEFVDYELSNGIIISLDDYSTEEIIFDFAKRVYLNEITIESAVQELILIDDGYSNTTYNIIINAFLSMMNGEMFSRSLPYKMIDVFIRRISNDFGPEKRKNALKSTLMMLDNYYNQTGQPLKEHRSICQKISDEFDDGFVFDYKKDDSSAEVVEKTSEAKNHRTILEAIAEVLSTVDKPLTASEIYNNILAKGLYSFGAIDPLSVVKTTVSRACKDVQYSKKQKNMLFGCIVNAENKHAYYLLSKESAFQKSNREQLIEELVEDNHIVEIKERTKERLFFEDWLKDKGYMSGTVSGYSGAIISAENYAKDHKHNNCDLFTKNRALCKETIEELFESKGFLDYNKSHGRRFSIAIKRLIECYGIECKIQQENSSNYNYEPLQEETLNLRTPFEKWLVEKGFKEGSAKGYSSAIITAEKYAVEHGFNNQALYTDDKELCSRTALELINNEEFISFNKNHSNRFVIAIRKLLEFYEIDLDLDKCISNKKDEAIEIEDAEKEEAKENFKQWLMTQGKSKSTIAQLVSAVSSSEKYAESNHLYPCILLSLNEEICKHTAVSLLNSKSFRKHDEESGNRFGRALVALLKSLGVDFDYKKSRIINATASASTFELSSDNKSAIFEFESWLTNNGYSKKIIKKYINLVIEAEFYIEEHSIKPDSLLTIDEDLCLQTAIALFSDDGFCTLNAGRMGQFDVAITKLLQSYGIAFDYRNPNNRGEYKNYDNPYEEYEIPVVQDDSDIKLDNNEMIDNGFISKNEVEESNESVNLILEDIIQTLEPTNTEIEHEEELDLMDRIRKEFETIELIGDIPISDEEYEQLKYYFVFQCNSHFKNKRILMVDPICATFLVQLSIRESDANYWAYVDKVFTKETLGQNEHAYIGKSFIETLKQYNKAFYSGIDNDYVKNIQFHGFVSNYRADNLFEFVYKYYDLDLDRDFEENQRDNNFDELISAIIKNDKTNRTSLIVQQTADALKKCESLGRKKILYILELIDRKYMGVKSRVDFDYEDTRIKDIFENWTHKKNSSFSKRIGEAIEKRFRTPILKCNYQNNSFSILLPKQSIKVDAFNENDIVNWKILTDDFVIIEKVAEYKQSIIGISTFETEVPLDSKFLFKALSFELYLNDSLVKSFSPVKDDDYRFFDVRGDYGIHTDFDMLKEGNYYSFKTSDESSDSSICDDIIETVELGGLLRTAYSFVKGSTILLPNKRFHIVSQEKYSDGLVNKHLLDYISVNDNGNLIPVFSQFPSLIIGVDANKAKGTLISVNHQKFRMFDERVTTEEIGYHGNKVYYSVNLSELDRFSSGVYCVETDIGSGYSNKKWSFAYFDNLQIEFINTPYIFKDKISLKISNGFSLSGLGVDDEKLNEYSFNLNLDDYPKKVKLQLNNDSYDIILSPPVFKWEKDDVLTKDNLDYYWFEDIPKKIYYDMSGYQLDFQLDYGFDAAPIRSSGKYIETNSIKSYSDSNNGIQELYVVCDNRKYLLFKVVSKTIVKSINLSRDRLTDNLTVDIDILGNRKYYISVIKNGQTLLEKTPVLKGLNILEIEAETSEYLISVYELTEDYDFGADYSLVDTRQIYYVNPSDLVGHKLMISGFINEEGKQFDLPKENNIFVKVQQQLDENSFLGKLYQTKEQYKHTHGIGSISTRDFKSYPVLITIDNYSNLSLMKMLLQDEEDFLFDSKHGVFVDVEKEGLSFEKRIERYKELYEAKFIVKYEEE